MLQVSSKTVNYLSRCTLAILFCHAFSRTRIYDCYTGLPEFCPSRPETRRRAFRTLTLFLTVMSSVPHVRVTSRYLG